MALVWLRLRKACADDTNRNKKHTVPPTKPTKKTHNEFEPYLSYALLFDFRLVLVPGLRSVHLYLFVFNFDEAGENDCAHTAYALHVAYRPTRARHTHTHNLIWFCWCVKWNYFKPITCLGNISECDSLHAVHHITHTHASDIGRKSRFHSVWKGKLC